MSLGKKIKHQQNVGGKNAIQFLRAIKHENKVKITYYHDTINFAIIPRKTYRKGSKNHVMTLIQKKNI